MDSTPGFGLYVHWPYCARICPYCDFNVYKAKTDTDDLARAMLLDMKAARKHTGARTLSSIHFGGGTPSLMAKHDLQRFIDTATHLWTPAPDIEIGLEANPNDVTHDTLADWQAVGINRLSIGVQSFDDGALKFLGRDHDGVSARQSLARAAQVIPRVSCDLIFGLKAQNLHAWAHDLEASIKSGVSHISAYQLTVKPGTAFARAQGRGDDKSVNDDMSADFYALARENLLAAGFRHYEVSNFAKSKADRSKHNLLYWQGADYVGIGPGAHGRLTTGEQRSAIVCAAKPKAYIDSVYKTGQGASAIEVLSPDDIASEYVLMGLRSCEGISLSRLEAMSSKLLNQQALETQLKLGHVIQEGGRLRPTAAGFLLLDAVSLALLS